jgi:hypothetical protein
MRVHLNDRACVLDSHPASGLSVTLSSDTARDAPVIHHRLPQIPQHSAISEISQRLFPTLHQKINRTVTMPRTATLLPSDTVQTSQSRHETVRVVPYLSFSTIVGRNSVFHGLTEAQLEEVGGIEFRALNMLMWAVPLVRRGNVPGYFEPGLNVYQYYFFSLAIPFIVVAPYILASRWRGNFLVPAQHREINPVW